MSININYMEITMERNYFGGSKERQLMRIKRDENQMPKVYPIM
jgi:hypothetical protein